MALDEFDFDERLNDIPDNEDIKGVAFKEDRFDLGHSVSSEQYEPNKYFKNWTDLRGRMSEGYDRYGIFVGTLAAIAQIALSIVSLPVTLIRYLVFREARPYDYDSAIKNMRAAEEIKDKGSKNHKEDYTRENEKNEEEYDYYHAKRNREVESVKSDNALENNEKAKNNKTNDRIRVTNAVNNLRTEGNRTNSKGNVVPVKKIAGISFIGYSPKTGNLMFYHPDRSMDTVFIDSKNLTDVNTTKEIADIYVKEETKSFLKSMPITVDEDYKINPVVMDSIVLTCNIKAGLLLASIHNELLNDNTENEDILLSKATFSMDGADRNMELMKNGNSLIIKVDNEIKDTIQISDLKDISNEKCNEIVNDIIGDELIINPDEKEYEDIKGDIEEEEETATSFNEQFGFGGSEEINTEEDIHSDNNINSEEYDVDDYEEEL